MAKLLIVYGTTEGHSRRVAERIAATARLHGHSAGVVDSAGDPFLDDRHACDAVVVVASVHQGKHQAAVARFVERNLPALQRVPTAFFSVSLAAAIRDEEHQEEAQRYVEDFVAETHWHPDMTRLVAGALLYSQYDFFKRLAMRFIALREGRPTDPADDYEYTDWEELRRFVEEFLERVTGFLAEARPMPT